VASLRTVVSRDARLAPRPGDTGPPRRLRTPAPRGDSARGGGAGMPRIIGEPAVGSKTSLNQRTRLSKTERRSVQDYGLQQTGKETALYVSHSGAVGHKQDALGLESSQKGA